MAESERVSLHPALVERLVKIARRLAAAHRPEEAADLLEIAAVLSPQGGALLDEAEALREQSAEDVFDREFKRRNLEASHAIGMGHILLSRGEVERAEEMFDFAKLRTPFHYLGYAAGGFLNLRSSRPAAALQEFAQARRLNPLDLRLAVEASRAALQIESYHVALEHAVDALLLSQWGTDREQQRDRRRVSTLARLGGRSEAEVDALVRERAEALQQACDRVALSRARIFSGRRPSTRRRPRAEQAPDDDTLLPRAAELRTMPILRHLTDEQLISLARLVRPVSFSRMQVLFREGMEGRDLFLVREGRVHITRRTPAGTQVIAVMGPGSLFGEVAFVDRDPRSATAIGVESGSLYVLSAGDADGAMDEDRDLGLALLWSFWQSLADKVRSANAQMGELAEPGAGAWERVPAHDPGEPVTVAPEEKLDLLRRQGLSGHELRILASYAAEQRFRPDAYIFAEGERGDNLYIVVDGAVRISKLVPGMGEECLAILHRGEVFGEMALIDDQPRSADARAHLEGCTVFSLSRSALTEALAMDPDASSQFLTLLCRLLCSRLRAMNDRLVAWRVMASHR